MDKTATYAKDDPVWVSLKDRERVDRYTRIGDAIFGGEIACNVEPLKGIDIETFQVLVGTNYARDKNHVYYPLEELCVDTSDCGVCYYSKILMKTVRPEKIKYLGKEYVTAGKNVYFRGKLIEKADGATFKIIDGPEYFIFATDKNNVFRQHSIFEHADAKTFYYDKTDKRNVSRKYEHKFIIGDKNNKWEFIPPNTINEIEKMEY